MLTQSVVFVYELERGTKNLVYCHPNIKKQHLLGVSYRGHLHLIGNPTERKTQWLPEKLLSLKVRNTPLAFANQFSSLWYLCYLIFNGKELATSV